MKITKSLKDTTIKRLSEEEDRLALLEMAKEENDPKHYEAAVKVVDAARKYHKHQEKEKTCKSTSVA
ncbi:MAG: hypothetical protein OXE44_06995 [Nitrospinae bacterium]|nr:hypothetical protein [Nitrospinota bacterium]